ncbi:maleylpyruvate isomerase N-terminal domain-containing protein [Streptomyces sp. NBC_00069]|uniref:maleylpyruvate isomerase N-terminal domain-containing protein n=1 Tax=Streptomyces sp. NBC_00069 TaxID=2975639 RepID=UPI0032515A55
MRRHGHGSRPSTPLPTCPGWTLGDLTRHVGSEHRWFSALLRRRIQQPPTRFARSALSDFQLLGP